MSKISDELREFADAYEDRALRPTLNRRLHHIADRIDAEMVELPRDADGKPMHLNDKIYDLNGYEHEVFSLYLYEKAPTIDSTSPTWRVGLGFGNQIAPRDLTHHRHDSLERVADELDDWRKGAVEERRIRTSDNDDVNDFIDRIRKLAKEREHE